LFTVPSASPVASAGAHWSTLDDLARFAVALMAGPDGRPVLPVDAVIEPWTPNVALTDTLSYGLGWFVEQSGDRLVVHHGGDTLGFTTEMAFVPASSLALAVRLLRTGSFSTRLVPLERDGSDGRTFLMRDPPLILTAVTLEADDGVTTLTFGRGIDTYRFERVGEP